MDSARIDSTTRFANRLTLGVLDMYGFVRSFGVGLSVVSPSGALVCSFISRSFVPCSFVLLNVHSFVGLFVICLRRSVYRQHKADVDLFLKCKFNF